MTIEDLRTMQSWSLERKIQVTQTRIIEWYQHYKGQVYVSFSGGKDSTVLLDLARRIYPDIEAVYVDTGLEYPEVKDFVKQHDNVTILRPKKTFRQVINEYGYPLISKEISDAVSLAKRGFKCGIEKLNGKNTDGTENKFREGNIKYKYLIESPFMIGDECCAEMKKKPAKKFEKETNKHPIIATMAEESAMRKTSWIRTGCNAFESKRPTSKPMSFWTEQDVLQYLKRFNIPYASVYGDIVATDKNGNIMDCILDYSLVKLETTGCKRTGCMFCGFGCHLEKEPNRFQKLYEIHPKIYNYCINGGEYVENGLWKPNNKGLGMGKVLDYIGVKY